MSRFGKVAGDMLLRACGAIGKADVVTIIELVRAGHCRRQSTVSIVQRQTRCQPGDDGKTLKDFVHSNWNESTPGDEHNLVWGVEMGNRPLTKKGWYLLMGMMEGRYNWA